jgi:hypothetical protein
MSYCRPTLLVRFSLGFVFSLAFAQASHDAASNAQLASPEIEQKVDTLLKRMTFDEKIGQLDNAFTLNAPRPWETARAMDTGLCRTIRSTLHCSKPLR